MLVLILIVGPALYIAIVLYENFGADSQKRTIINRLCSFLFCNIAINSCIWGVTRILRDIFGLLPNYVFMWARFFFLSMGGSAALFATEITMFRFLYIVIWKRMKPINDEFWTRVLALSNYVISVTFFLAAYLVGDRSSETVAIITLAHNEGIP